MSMGMDFTADMFIGHLHVKTLQDVEEEIRHTKENIQYTKERILMYCASGPSGVCNKDCEGNPVEPVEALHHEMRQLFESYEEDLSKLYDLELLWADWDEKTQQFKTAQYC